MDISKKLIVGGAVAAVLLLVVIINWFSSGSPSMSTGDEAQRLASIGDIVVDGGSSAGDALAKVAKSDPSPKVRRKALAGMSHFLTPLHRQTVQECVKDPDPAVREVAVDILGLYRDKQASDELVKIVKNEPEEKVQQAACRGLERCDDPMAIVALMEQAEKGATMDLKRVAMKCLLSKLGVRISRDRNPKDDRGWRDLIQRWKMSRRVQDAYSRANVRLVSKPQDFMGKDWHPERRGK
ncbi:MAG: HEAT repeat domain-containing protein [Phycisphaerales bacterium]|nr:HEAT repeat domain-containing protein [Phycisphaerales bacterium]